MLIRYEEIINILNANHISVKGEGGVHIGAHKCEELPFYNKMGIQPVLWIDAIPSTITEIKHCGISNAYHAVITDKDDADVAFKV